MKNEKIRIAMIKRNLKLYEVADLLGMRETSFSRKMRTEMSGDEQKRIINIINGVSEQERK